MCTGIIIIASDGTVVAGRTLEFAQSLEWYQICNDDMIVVGTAAETGQEPCVVDGVNRYGLYVGCFYFECGQPSFYHGNGNSMSEKKLISTLEVSGLLLRNCECVEDVLKTIPNWRVFLGTATLPGGGSGEFPLHYFVCDKQGQSAVLEAHDGGKLMAHVGPGVRALTNFPFYEDQVQNLQRYAGCSAITTQGSCYQGTGAGDPYNDTCRTGCCLPGDSTPPSRFVRVSFYLAHLPTPMNAADAMQKGFSILRNFDIPYGSVLSYENKEPDITQYTVMYNVTKQTQTYAPYGYGLSKRGEKWLATSTPVRMCEEKASGSFTFFLVALMLFTVALAVVMWGKRI